MPTACAFCAKPVPEQGGVTTQSGVAFCGPSCAQAVLPPAEQPQLDLPLPAPGEASMPIDGKGRICIGPMGSFIVIPDVPPAASTAADLQLCPDCGSPMAVADREFLGQMASYWCSSCATSQHGQAAPEPQRAAPPLAYESAREEDGLVVFPGTTERYGFCDRGILLPDLMEVVDPAGVPICRFSASDVNMQVSPGHTLRPAAYPITVHAHGRILFVQSLWEAAGRAADLASYFPGVVPVITLFADVELPTTADLTRGPVVIETPVGLGCRRVFCTAFPCFIVDPAVSLLVANAVDFEVKTAVPWATFMETLGPNSRAMDELIRCDRERFVIYRRA